MSDRSKGRQAISGVTCSLTALARRGVCAEKATSGRSCGAPSRESLLTLSGAWLAVLQVGSIDALRRRAGGLAALLLIAGSTALVFSSGAAQAAPCEAAGASLSQDLKSGEGGAPVWEEAVFRVGEVLPDGTLGLEDGRTVRLAGVYLDAAAGHVLTGLELRLMVLDVPDRWGRVPVLATAGYLLQGHLLAEGLAAVWPLMVPASLPPGCDAEFARAEAVARAARKGLWGRSVPQPGPQPGLRQDARDPQAVLARNGRFAIVEGRVESLGKARDTRYLNFGGRWATDFTVTFSSSIEGQLAAKGMDPARMEGARVRVRGVVLEKDGPHIEVTDPAQIEWAN